MFDSTSAYPHSGMQTVSQQRLYTQPLHPQPLHPQPLHPQPLQHTSVYPRNATTTPKHTPSSHGRPARFTHFHLRVNVPRPHVLQAMKLDERGFVNKVIGFLNEEFEAYTAQLESCPTSGKRHLQMVVRHGVRKSVVNMTSLWFHKFPHLLNHLVDASGTPVTNERSGRPPSVMCFADRREWFCAPQIFKHQGGASRNPYCMKAETRVLGPWTKGVDYGTGDQSRNSSNNEPNTHTTSPKRPNPALRNKTPPGVVARKRQMHTSGMMCAVERGHARWNPCANETSMKDAADETSTTSCSSLHHLTKPSETESLTANVTTAVSKKDEHRKAQSPGQWTFQASAETVHLIRPEQFYTWQKELLRILVRKADNRTIHWFWEPHGNTGKSQFAKFLCGTEHFPEGFVEEARAAGHPTHGDSQIRAVLGGGKASDLKCMITDIAKNNGGYFPRIVLMDLSRTASSPNKHIDYQGIEEVKNGSFFSGKYGSSFAIYNHPHVVVFANHPPPHGKLSKDRLHVQRVSIDKTPELRVTTAAEALITEISATSNDRACVEADAVVPSSLASGASSSNQEPGSRPTTVSGDTRTPFVCTDTASSPTHTESGSSTESDLVESDSSEDTNQSDSTYATPSE